MGIQVRYLTEQDWEAVKSIYEEGLQTKNATFQTESPTKDHWFKSHITSCSLAANKEDGEVVGWATVSPISTRPVYAGVGEVSVYVKRAAQGLGVGSLLMSHLVRLTEEEGFWMLQSGIFPENVASIELHRKFGFREVGRRERLGKHYGMWRDVLLFERRSMLIGLE